MTTQFYFNLLAVLDTNFFSEDADTPHVVTVLEGQPTAIDCGPFTNTPSSDIRWEVKFGTRFVPISFGNDRAVVGLNDSLYLLDPTIAHDQRVFSCNLRNTELQLTSTGYVRINVQGMYSLSLHLIDC